MSEQRLLPSLSVTMWSPSRFSSGEVRRRVKIARALVFEAAGSHAYSRPALNGLDSYLVDVLGGQVGGVFVEAGANDGYAQSNTYYLERVLGWSGLLIEPFPHLAGDCRRIRSRSICVEAAIVGPEQAGETVRLEYAHLMSLVADSVIGGTTASEHLELGRRLTRSMPGHIDVIGRTLSSVFDQVGITEVDLLSLDVEGFEANALRGLDLLRYRPLWILVEANDPEAVDGLLQPLYQLHSTPSERDRLYRRLD